MEQHIQVDRRFAIIDEWILDLEVSDRAIRLYAILVRYADKDTHKAFPSRKTLAKRLRCSTKSVDRAIQELIDARLLSKEQRFNSSLVFTLHTVSPPLSRGVDSGDQGGWTPESRGVDTGVDLTITTELEAINDIVQKRASQIPADWKPTPEFAKECEAKFPSLNIANEVEAFRDHHASKGSTFKDHDAAFRTWCRNSVKWQSPAQRRNEAPTPGPGKREWVKPYHAAGQHWACNPNEFPEGCH